MNWEAVRRMVVSQEDFGKKLKESSGFATEIIVN